MNQLKDLNLKKDYLNWIEECGKKTRNIKVSTVKTDAAIAIAEKNYSLKKNEDGFYLLNSNKKLSKDLPQHAIHTALVGLELLPAKWSIDHNQYQFVTDRHVNVCPNAGVCGAKNNCLVFTSPYTNAMKKRSRRKDFLFEQPDSFMRVLEKDIETAFSKYKKPAFRLNVFSDILWEHLLPKRIRTKLSGHIYDYTKIPGRAKTMPPGFQYKLTYSFSEKDQKTDIPSLVNEYGSVAVVFPVGQMPKEILKIPVIDGDAHDYRIGDKNVIVGLKAKAALSYKNNQNNKMLYR